MEIARILHIAYSGAGGTGEVAVELARGADRRRFQSLVCFLGVEPVAPSFRRRLDASGVNWSYVPVRGPIGSLWHLYQRCARLEPHLVVAHGATNALVLPLLRIFRPRVKCVAVYHGPPRLAKALSGIFRCLPGLLSAHTAVSVAPHLARLLRQKLGCDSPVITNGVNTEEWEVNPGPPGRDHGTLPAELLMVATLSPTKDQQTLLDATALLSKSHTGFRLVLVGDGILRPALEQRARELGLGPLAHFAGDLSFEEARSRLSNATVFVYATHEEGCPLAVLEAMAAGRPIVASRVPGMIGLLEHRRTALLVPPRDPAALADALAELLSSPETATELGRAAREVALQRHRLGDCIRAYETLFDSLLLPGSTSTLSESFASRTGIPAGSLLETPGGPAGPAEAAGESVP